MKKFLLVGTAAAILCGANIHNAYARGEITCDCGSTENGGSEDDCCWTITEDNVIKIFPAEGRTNVKMRDYSAWNTWTTDYSPWAIDFYNENIHNIEISDGISSIGAYAFGSGEGGWIDSEQELNISIPDSVTSIGDGAFLGAYATSINMPDTITDIGKYAFANNRLEKIDIPDYVENIGDFAFANAQSEVYDGYILLPDSYINPNWMAFADLCVSDFNLRDYENFASGSGNYCFSTHGSLDIICQGDEEHCYQLNDEFEEIKNGAAYNGNSYFNIGPSAEEDCNSSHYQWNGYKCVYACEAIYGEGHGLFYKGVECDGGESSCHNTVGGICISGNPWDCYEYIGGICKDMPEGCDINYDHRCNVCEEGYLWKDLGNDRGVCIPEEEGCGDGKFIYDDHDFSSHHRLICANEDYLDDHASCFIEGKYCVNECSEGNVEKEDYDSDFYPRTCVPESECKDGWLVMRTSYSSYPRCEPEDYCYDAIEGNSCVDAVTGCSEGNIYKEPDWNSCINGCPGTCIPEADCKDGYVVDKRNNDYSQCILETDCSGTIIGNSCEDMPPNCLQASDGACSECTSGFLTQNGVCISADACQNGLHEENGACVTNDDANCNTQKGKNCTECKGGYLEQDGSCVTSCGPGYKNMGGFCNRVRWTPAEAAKVLKENDNTVVLTFRK